jgi:cytochrome P450 family 142 subfamily A polypeptide 1
MDGRLYADRARAHAAYAWMRANEPIYHDEEHDLYGIASYDAVREASLDRSRFSSAGGIRPDFGPLPMMIDMDDPEHTQRRKLVNRGFTPRRVRDLEPQIRATCDGLIDAVSERGTCDFVRDLAAPLPMAVIGDLLGVEPADRATLLQWSDDMVSAQGGNVTEEKVQAAVDASAAYYDHATNVIARRREEPTGDLMTVLINAEIDGERLTDDEIIRESLLILVGGDETTRHVLSGGMEQLLANPDQHRALVHDPAALPGAIEEMLRWVTPIKNMCRTVVDDTRLHATKLPAGRKVMLLYESANFDEGHFDEPERFDITRSPNEHLAFGIGNHFCLGNALGRLELHVMFERLLARLPDMELESDGALPRREANFISGLEAMPVRFSPVGPPPPA